MDVGRQDERDRVEAVDVLDLLLDASQLSGRRCD